MNLNDLKSNGTNSISITDSLKAPLLKLNISINENTTIPTENDLIVYVAKSSEDTAETKSYIFTLENPLKYYNGTSDEFIIEPTIDNEKVSLKGYVNRKVGENALLENPTIEEVDIEAINLYEGNNYIYTNYTNCTINIIYPKNVDLVNLFLNTTLYGLNNKDKVLSLDDIYFKDCFTKIEDKINAQFNKLSVKCFESTNQNFSMDCDGNLVVNTITVKQEGSSGTEEPGLTFDQIYPIGSIYISVNDTNPSTLFGNTWEAFGNGRVLVGVDSSQTEFNTVLKTGGHKELQSHNHSATISNAGSHQHTGNTLEVQMKNTVNTRDCARNINSSYDYSGVTITNAAGDHSHNITINNSGNGNAGNLQPYICVYMWRRIA